MIIKEIAKEDKRNQMISLTEKGKVLYPQIKNIIEKTNEVMLKGINQNQQTLLNELILKMKDNLEEKNEKYIAPLYNYMIEKGMDVTISIVDADKVHVLGTPEELQIFLKEKM